MGVEPGDAVAELFRYERRRLVALGYRMLGTAGVRREKYVGQWLPEPVPANVSLIRRQTTAGRSPGQNRVTVSGRAWLVPRPGRAHEQREEQQESDDSQDPLNFQTDQLEHNRADLSYAS